LRCKKAVGALQTAGSAAELGVAGGAAADGAALRTTAGTGAGAAAGAAIGINSGATMCAGIGAEAIVCACALELSATNNVCAAINAESAAARLQQADFICFLYAINASSEFSRRRDERH
jgi:hypothetical protein